MSALPPLLRPSNMSGAFCIGVQSICSYSWQFTVRIIYRWNRTTRYWRNCRNQFSESRTTDYYLTDSSPVLSVELNGRQRSLPSVSVYLTENSPWQIFKQIEGTIRTKILVTRCIFWVTNVPNCLQRSQTPYSWIWVSVSRQGKEGYESWEKEKKEKRRKGRERGIEKDRNWWGAHSFSNFWIRPCQSQMKWYIITVRRRVCRDGLPVDMEHARLVETAQDTLLCSGLPPPANTRPRNDGLQRPECT